MDKVPQPSAYWVLYDQLKRNVDSLNELDIWDHAKKDSEAGYVSGFNPLAIAMDRDFSCYAYADTPRFTDYVGIWYPLALAKPPALGRYIKLAELTNQLLRAVADLGWSGDLRIPFPQNAVVLCGEQSPTLDLLLKRAFGIRSGPAEATPGPSVPRKWWTHHRFRLEVGHA